MSGSLLEAIRAEVRVVGRPLGEGCTFGVFLDRLPAPMQDELRQALADEGIPNAAIIRGARKWAVDHGVPASFGKDTVSGHRRGICKCRTTTAS